MDTLWRLFEWIGLFLGVVIAGLVLAFFLARRSIVRHVEEELGEETLLLATEARVGQYDSAKDGKSHTAAGMLMLLSSGLYFHSWVGNREVFVPGPSISWIGVSEERTRSRLERHRIVVRFLNTEGKEDGIAIRILSPEQWVDAIKTHLISRAK
jgi:hypothetical protein